MLAGAGQPTKQAVAAVATSKCIGLWVIVPTLEAVPEVVYSARGCIEIQSSFPLNIKHTRYGQHHTWAAILAAAIHTAATSQKDTHPKVMAQPLSQPVEAGRSELEQ